MSISPPSDIILDVARAADPLRYREAAGRLNRVGGPGPGEDFAEAFDEVIRLPPVHLPFDSMAASTRLRTNAALTQSQVAVPPMASCATPAADTGDAAAFRRFEGMALTSMIETMLPSGAESVFGAGSAGQIWKSMLSEQMAVQVSEAGGVGIADMLAARAAQQEGDGATPGSAAEVLAGLGGTASIPGVQALRNPADLFAGGLRALDLDADAADADRV